MKLHAADEATGTSTRRPRPRSSALLADEALLVESGRAHRHVHRHGGAAHAHYHVHDAE